MKQNPKTECTSIIVGRNQMADGSLVFARSEDGEQSEAKNLEICEDTESGPEEFAAKDSPFRCPLPAKRLGYSALAPYTFPGHWGEAGYNSLGVGMSATESIFASEKALEADPYVETGLGENAVFNVVLPYIRSAREGVERLGSMIEEYGSAEGFGIGFIDQKEIWYLENAGGHRWLACKMPSDKYFVTGNQSRFRTYDPEDKENFMASSDLMDFAREHGLWDPAKGEFDFHEAYSRDIEEDHTYNYPRVWGLQKMFTPSVVQDVARNTFPVYQTADKKLTISDLRKAFRYHYDDTEHDPYLHSNGKEPWRPISIFRTNETHILSVRPWLPKEIGCLDYMAEGMADLGVFLPLYQGVHSYPLPYLKGNGASSNNSAYWKFRHVMILAMMDYNTLAPIVKHRYAALEAENDQRQKEMEENYLALCKKRPIAASELLQEFSDKVLCRALDVADELTEELFSRLAAKIQKEYLFHGA